MCIFNTVTEEVSGTRILVAPLPDNRQLVVYENQVTSTTDNAMILPVPCDPDGVITMVDMSGYTDIFEDCEKYFEPPSPSYDSNNWGSGKDEYDLASFAAIEVLQVGAYKVSIVPSIDDLDRLDDEVFKLTPKTKSVLSAHYARGFQFVVCMFSAADSIQHHHPIAYTHPRLPTPFGITLFVPTVHEHGSTHDDTKKPPSGLVDAHFDHTIYSVNTAPDGGLFNDSWTLSEHGITKVVWDKVVPNVPFKFMRKRRLVGLFPNTDLILTIAAETETYATAQ